MSLIGLAVIIGLEKMKVPGNTARYLHFFQTDDHRKANQRHHHREAVKVPQRHRALAW
jgi:hypothetical protein